MGRMSLPPPPPGAPPRAALLSSVTWDTYGLRLKPRARPERVASRRGSKWPAAPRPRRGLLQYANSRPKATVLSPRSAIIIRRISICYTGCGDAAPTRAEGVAAGPELLPNAPLVKCGRACPTYAAPLSQTAADCFHKENVMHQFALALLLSAALAGPALAQKKEEPKKDAAKVAIPTNTFFKGQTA